MAYQPFERSAYHELEKSAYRGTRRSAYRRRLKSSYLEKKILLDILTLEANARLKRKHDALKKAGKHADAAKAAVVSGLARWMWAMGLQVQREQAAA